MEAVLASPVAVLGTLVGPFGTHLFQHRTACSEFASAAPESKRGPIAARFRRCRRGVR
ncbi:hypothetical protein [Kitasatospora terrestris]|uniref:hypothetical protein n=1 Tax=Kitasatospora terrestris TaxID=258051 RepID=UPI0031EAE18F